MYIRAQVEPHLLNKFAPIEKCCLCIFVKFLESAHINLIHILAEFQRNHWSRSAKVIRPSYFAPKIIVIFSVTDAL